MRGLSSPALSPLPFCPPSQRFLLFFFLPTLSHCVISKTSSEVNPWHSTRSFGCMAHWLFERMICYLSLSLNSSLLLMPSVSCPETSFKAYNACTVLSLSLCFLKVFWELHYTSRHTGLCKREETTKGHPLSVVGFSAVPWGNLCAGDSKCSFTGA